MQAETELPDHLYFKVPGYTGKSGKCPANTDRWRDEP